MRRGRAVWHMHNCSTAVRGNFFTGCSLSEPCNGVQAFSKEMEYLDAKVPREVPVAWFGVASEVRLMGSFDGWTRGVDLNADDISDSVFTRFEATVLLLPVPSLHLLPLTQGFGKFCGSGRDTLLCYQTPVASWPQDAGFIITTCWIRFLGC